MANNEKSTLVHDAIALFIITLVAGVLLGAVYMITKDPIAQAEEKATNEAYAAVYKDAEFANDDALTKALESFQSDVTAGNFDADMANATSYTDVELMEARTASSGGSQVGYVVKVSGKGYGGAVTIGRLVLPMKVRYLEYRYLMQVMRLQVLGRTAQKKTGTASILA